MSAYENTVLDSTVNYISDLADYVSKPWQRPEGADYFGGKEGLDIADPLDIAWSTGSSAYRIFDKLGRWPFAKSMMYGGDLLSGLVGDNITSQEEAEAFMTKYDPEGSISKAGFDIKYHPDPNVFHAGNNFFPGAPGALGLLTGRKGINITPHKGWEGVNPITAAEEVEHARRYSTGATGSRFYEDPTMKSMGDLGDYLGRLYEETMAKGTAFGNVAKNEGILEALASIPSLIGTYASYAIPSSKQYRLGEVGAGGQYGDPNFSKALADKAAKENISMDDLMLSYWGDGDLEYEKIKKDFGVDLDEFDIDMSFSKARQIEKIQEADIMQTISNWWNRPAPSMFD
tara:strand:+ start:1972 stop:3003 length:1032 start_codon:yes stop_codon:yes gene_type:complete